MELQRIIPSNIEQVVKDKSGHCIIYLYKNSLNKVCAKGFSGRRNKPDFCHNFRDENQRTLWVTDYLNRTIESLNRRNEYKAKEKQDRIDGANSFAKQIKVGDLFCSSISYTMTLNTFYQVVEIKNKTLKLVKCHTKWIDGDMGYAGHVSAMPLTNEEIKNAQIVNARINGDKRIKLDNQDRYAYLTSENERHYENHLD